MFFIIGYVIKQEAPRHYIDIDHYGKNPFDIMPKEWNDAVNKFTKDTIDYIYKSIEHIKKNVEKPKFFIWSNDLSNLSGYFNQDECIFIDNKQNKNRGGRFRVLKVNQQF